MLDGQRINLEYLLFGNKIFFSRTRFGARLNGVRLIRLMSKKLYNDFLQDQLDTWVIHTMIK